MQLFNALTKAQQARWNSEVQGEKTNKGDKASKAALLKVLKPDKPEEGAKRSSTHKHLCARFFSGWGVGTPEAAASEATIEKVCYSYKMLKAAI